jgi:hypothetical protein
MRIHGNALLTECELSAAPRRRSRTGIVESSDIEPYLSFHFEESRRIF